MATRMMQRRGTAAEWAAANEILAEAALGLEEDTDIIKMGDGVTPWNDLANDRVYIPLAQQDARYVARGLVNAAGDLLVGSADDTLTRLPRGTVGSRLTIQPDLSLAWVDLPPAANPFTGVDAVGDLLVGSAPDTVARLPAGAEGRVLQILGGLPAWVVPAAADLSTRVAKTGDTMTGQLNMANVKVRLMTGAAPAVGDVTLDSAGGAGILRALTNAGAPAQANFGPLFDGGNRVYSASNPPPVSGMTVLGGFQGSIPRWSVAANYNDVKDVTATTGAASTTFVAPPSGKVTIQLHLDSILYSQGQDSGWLTARIPAIDSGTPDRCIRTTNGSYWARGENVSVYTGLTPGTTYTVQLSAWAFYTSALAGNNVQGISGGFHVSIEG